MMETRSGLIRTAAAVLLGLLFFIPLWWVIVSALRPEDEIFRYLSPLSPWTLWPTTVTFESVAELWTGSFALPIFNSLIVALATLIIGLTICAMAAFVLAVIEFPFRNAIFMLLIISFLIPFDAVAFPLLGIMRELRLQNTYAGLVLPGVGNGLAIFLLRQFFMGIPRDLHEAARVDGLGWGGVLWHIYLPLSGPALIGAGIIIFIFQWQAYLWPLLIAPAPELKVASVALAQFSNTVEVQYNLIFAGAAFIALVPMVIMTALQRYFIRSVASSGGKE
jgi:putative chitobiose transport system permease protein